MVWASLWFSLSSESESESKSGIFHTNLNFRFIWNIPDFDFLAIIKYTNYQSVSYNIVLSMTIKVVNRHVNFLPFDTHSFS